MSCVLHLKSPYGSPYCNAYANIAFATETNPATCDKCRRMSVQDIPLGKRLVRPRSWRERPLELNDWVVTSMLAAQCEALRDSIVEARR